MKELKGIDVSTLQGDIDWKRVRAAGIDFAMIKATQGRGEGAATRHLTLFGDPRFKRNIDGAYNAGISCGVWHYFTARTISEAHREAEYFIKAIEPYRSKIALWAAVDVESEEHLPDVSRTQLTAAVRAFIQRVQEAGFKPMLYTNPDFLAYRFTPDAFDDVDIWLAHWMLPTGTPMNVPNKCIWQYGSVGNANDVKKGLATLAEGRIPGINAACDVDTGYFEIPTVSAQVPVYVVGNLYRIKEGDRYTSGLAVPPRLVGEAYRIAQVKPGRILLDELNSWIKV